MTLDSRQQANTYFREGLVLRRSFAIKGTGAHVSEVSPLCVFYIKNIYIYIYIYILHQYTLIAIKALQKILSNEFGLLQLLMVLYCLYFHWDLIHFITNLFNVKFYKYINVM